MLNKEDLNQILDRNVAWIENCDSKASIMLGMLGVTISIVFAFDYAKVIISTIKEKCLNTSFWNIVFLILLLLTVCSILYGGYKLIKSLVPQIDMKKLGNDEMLCHNWIIFFSSIATYNNYTKFLNSLKKTSDEDYLNDISSQIFLCAKICDLKFRNYKSGLYFSIGGLLGFAILMTLGYFA